MTGSTPGAINSDQTNGSVILTTGGPAKFEPSNQPVNFSATARSFQ
ncbi:hypothetical protein ACFLSA_04735 [Bacteroidota bacterium]